jgi:hypothetical protein
MVHCRVLCTLPNAGTLINGVKFSRVRLGMLSEAVSDEVAANFARIPGYTVIAPDNPDSGKLLVGVVEVQKRGRGRPIWSPQVFSARLATAEDDSSLWGLP